MTTQRIDVIRVPEPIGYAEMLDDQRKWRTAVEERRAPSALFLLEHTPVITLGRNAQAEHVLQTRDALAQAGVDLIETDRGGGVTYHGPGQLVAYPVLDLTQWRCSVGWYLRSLEEVVIRLLSTYGLTGERLEGYTGVWVNGAKVAAIGVGVHQWVSFHGTAINVCPDMAHFGLIVPCGIADKPVTSLRKLLGAEAPTVAEVMDAFEREFLAYFRAAPEDVPRPGKEE